MPMIIAECERCGGKWQISACENVDPDLLEGICGDCQEESEVTERPLTFRWWSIDRGDLEDEEYLPGDWLAI